MIAQKRSPLTESSMNRRSLLKRAGILGLSLPAAGMVLNACGSDNEKSAKAVAAFPSVASDTDTAKQAGTITEVTVVGKDIAFDPTEITVPAGVPVRLTFINEGTIVHDWEAPDVQASNVKHISESATFKGRPDYKPVESSGTGVLHAVAGAGETMVIEFTPEVAGAYPMQCTVPGHRQAGMVGTFIVSGEGAAQAETGHEADPHVVASPATASGTPYDAARLPNPEVAAPVGKREPQLIKQEIEIQEVVGYVDEGVAFQFWTFGGTIPGPMLRVRVGDTVELTLKNPAESETSHNIDLHAVTGPGGGASATLIDPGESATFRFKALNPGVYVYHCATAPIPHHISAGMYGLIVVEPEEGLPPVDREFYVMQGDLYLEGARGEKGLRPFSMDKMLDERPDYVVFNGAVGALAEDRAFKANVGETIRIFFGVGGPNLVSSFHVIGEIFDRVMVEGAAEWSTNIQTTLVPAGGATVVEFKAEVPGTLMMVDHSLGRLHKGAVGMIVIEGDENHDVFEIVSPAI